jgi:hypothetical protein
MVLSGDLRNIDSINEQWFAPGTLRYRLADVAESSQSHPPHRQIVSALRSSTGVSSLS